MGKIAGYAAWAALAGSLGMLVLSLLGFMHLRRVPVEEEVGTRTRVVASPATA